MRLKRIYDADLIPQELIEQVKENEWPADRFYVFMQLAQTAPTTFLNVILDDKHAIIGYFWYELDMLNSQLYINTLSIYEHLQGDGKALDLAIEFVKEHAKELQVKKVVWETNRPAFFTKKGFTEIPGTFLEYRVGEDHGQE